MRPYYEQDGCTIFHADCLDVLPTVTAVDHVITDPPYGIALANHAKGLERSDRSFLIVGDEDQSIGQAALTWAHERQIPVVAFASPQKPWIGPWRQYLVWDKGPAVGGGGDTETLWKASWELLQISGRRRSGQRDSSVLRFWTTPQASALHPAQKPEALLLYLVSHVTGQGETVLDPFMGSGTTLVACKRLGRSCVGIEREERYCEIAALRLRQGALFTEAVS